MAGHGWTWLDMAGISANGLKWQEMAGNSWTWLK
jgi:hypothetical protein